MLRTTPTIGLQEILVSKTGCEVAGHAKSLVRQDATHAKTLRFLAALDSNGIDTRTKSSLRHTVHSVDMITEELEVIEQVRRINILPDIQIKKTHEMKTELACFLWQKQYKYVSSMVFSCRSVKLEDYRATHERIGRAISKMSYKNGIFTKLGVTVLFRVTEAKFHRLKDGSIRVHVHCHLVVKMRPRKNFQKLVCDLREAAADRGLKKFVRVDRIGSDKESIEKAVSYLFNPLKSERDDELTSDEIVEYYTQSLKLKFFARLGQFAKFSSKLKPVVEEISVPVKDHFTGTTRTLEKKIVTRAGYRIVKLQNGEFCRVRRGVRTMSQFQGRLWNDGDDEGPSPQKLIAIAPPSATRVSRFARPKMIILNYQGDFGGLVDKCGAKKICGEVRARWNELHPNDAVSVEIARVSAQQINNTQLSRSRSGNSDISPFSPNHNPAENEKRRHFHFRGLMGDLRVQREAIKTWVVDFEAAGQAALDQLAALAARGIEGLQIGGVGGAAISMQAHVDLTKLKAEIAVVARQSDLVLNGRDFWRGGLRPRESRRTS